MQSDVYFEQYGLVCQISTFRLWISKLWECHLCWMAGNPLWSHNHGTWVHVAVRRLQLQAAILYLLT